MRDIHGQERTDPSILFFRSAQKNSNTEVTELWELVGARSGRYNDTGPRRAPSCPKAMPDAAAAVGVGPELIAERSGGCSSLGDIYTLSLHDAGIKVASGLEG